VSHHISVVAVEDLRLSQEACLCFHSRKSPTSVAVPINSDSDYITVLC
jgi:hypothetical protein